MNGVLVADKSGLCVDGTVLGCGRTGAFDGVAADAVFGVFGGVGVSAALLCCCCFHVTTEHCCLCCVGLCQLEGMPWRRQLALYTAW